MPCKPIVLCSALLLNQKRKQKQENSFLEVVVNPTLSRRGRSRGAARDGRCLPKHLDDHKCNHIHSRSRGHSHSHSHSHSQNKNKNKNKSIHTRTNDSYRGSSSQAHRDFIESTASASGSNGDIISLQEMPTCEIAHSRFIAAYPRFSETRALDELRATEYSHLDEEDLVCLDYCGFGLLSHAQREEEEEFFMEAEAEAEAEAEEEEEEEERRTTSDFMLTEVSANLWAHALFGSAPEGSMEHGIRSRIMEYLNIPESEYSLVFTASRGSSFKLLANAYPWSTTSRLVTMYDYESESVGWMEQRAAEKGARVFRARFRWPSLRVCSSELKLELLLGSSKRAISKKLNQACLPDHSSSPSPLHNSSRLNIVNWFDRVSHYHHQQQQCQSKTAKNDEKKKGLFVFPVQSRVTGAKYSYQWMSLAQKNQWHVMLDASALGPKDMDSLGLSLFRPDFITASFYKLFGGEPSGFGCLLIKNSVAQSIQDPSGAQVSGMVRIVPSQPRQFCSASSPSPSPSSSGNSEAFDIAEMISSFSGPVMNIPTFNELKMPSRMPPLCHVPENSSIDGVVMSPACSEEGNDDTDCNNAFFADAPALSPASSVCEDEPKAPTPPSNIVHLPQGRKDQRIRIKDLCSGLLHLRTGRVGNSADGNGEDDISVKDGVKIFPEEQNTSPTMLKHNNTQSQKSEGIPERLVLVLKKERGDGELREEDSVKIFPEKECTDLTTFKHQMSEESMVAEKLVLVLKKEREDGELKEPVELLEKVVVVDQRGLETIEEIEAEAEEDGPSILSVQRLNDDRLGAVPSTLKDNAICRETEGGFRLLGRRSSDHFSLSRVLCAVAGENNEPSRSRSICSGAHEEFSFRRSSGVSKSDNDEDQVNEDEEIMGDEGGEEEEPQLICGGLDHADMMGLHRTSSRLRFLINWLITSLLRLKHPSTHAPLVKIYGPRVRYDRGASVAFNVFDSHGNLVHPEVVRMLADQLNICLGLGFLRNIHFRGGGATNEPGFGDLDATDKLPFRVEVVTAALGLLSDFRDVYKLWVFMARFLDPEYVSRELSDHVIPSSM